MHEAPERRFGLQKYTGSQTFKGAFTLGHFFDLQKYSKYSKYGTEPVRQNVLNTLLEFIEEGSATGYGFTDPIRTIDWLTSWPEVKSVR